jgi:hypothetical protein
MRKQMLRSWLVLGAWLVLTGLLSAEGILVTDGALIESSVGQGWTAGARLDLARREFVSQGDILDVDVLRTTAQFGISLVPPVHAFVEAGWSKAELPQNEGEGGFSWTYGVDVALWQHVLQRSPVLGNTRTLGLNITAARQSTESNLRDADFSWEETRITPTVRYTVNRMQGDDWLPYGPAFTSVFGGLCYSDLKGDLGESEFEGNRDFGFVIGADMMIFDSWIFGISGTFFGDNDRTVGAGVRCNF